MPGDLTLAAALLVGLLLGVAGTLKLMRIVVDYLRDRDRS